MQFKAKGAGGKNFLRLKDGESADGIFAGKMREFRQHWGSGGKHPIICPEDDSCELCKEGKKSGFRFRANFIVKENGIYSAKILEQGWKVYDALEILNRDYDLEKHIVRITRKGSTKNDTTYSVLPIKGGEVTPDLAAKLSQVKLLDLEQPNQQGEKEEEEPPPPEIEFSDADEAAGVPF